MRVDSQKEALVAGLVKPNTVVEVLADGQVIGSTKSDDQGEFVVMGTLGETAASQTLTVRSGTSPAVEKKTDNNAHSGSVMASGGAKQNESNDYLEWTLSDDIFIVLPSLSKHKSKTNAKLKNIPLIVQSSSNDIKIIQKTEQPLVSGITIDSISYSNLGEALLVGRGNPSNKALVYLDNKLISSSDVGALGGWSSELTGIAAGIYKLRIDEVNSAGEVQSRIATPFKKESKDFLLNMVSGSITVQTGNSLWRIARRIFGKGIRYIEIYERNSDLIKDPHLIYPGQVFSIPTENYDS
jgi:LysM repeat protein